MKKIRIKGLIKSFWISLTNNVAMEKVLNNLKNMSGIWVQTGDTVLEGDFKKDTGIAGGNISAFGQDESHYIRTGKNRDNDLMGGV